MRRCRARTALVRSSPRDGKPPTHIEGTLRARVDRDLLVVAIILACLLVFPLSSRASAEDDLKETKQELREAKAWSARS